MSVWTKLATKAEINKTAKALRANGFDVLVVETGLEAKKKLLKIIPPGSKVLLNTSVTLDSIGAAPEIDESAKFHSVKKDILSLDYNRDSEKIKLLRFSPEIVVGSAQAVTHKGEILIASNTGSQIPSITYGSPKVILVIGTNKIVRDLNSGMKRIYKHALPLESVRAKKAYGVPGSQVSRILISAKEPIKKRTTVILVKEQLGF